MKTAFYAGSFDPVTLGHLDIMNRVSKMFDLLIVGIGINPVKSCFFEQEVRQKMIQDVLPASSNIKTIIYDGLTIDAAVQIGASILVRGIRGSNDLQQEMHIARLNRKISGLETVFITPSDEHILTSSTFVKQLLEFGKDKNLLRNLVPESVIKAIDNIKHE